VQIVQARITGVRKGLQLVACAKTIDLLETMSRFVLQMTARGKKTRNAQL
jgi:hypothetical protein